MPGPAYMMVFTWSSSGLGPFQAGAPLTFRVEIKDAQGAIVTDDPRTISISLVDAPGVVLQGTTSLQTVAGVATWTHRERLSIGEVGSYRLRATHSGAPFVLSDTVTVGPFDVVKEGWYILHGEGPALTVNGFLRLDTSHPTASDCCNIRPEDVLGAGAWDISGMDCHTGHIATSCDVYNGREANDIHSGGLLEPPEGWEEDGAWNCQREFYLAMFRGWSRSMLNPPYSHHRILAVTNPDLTISGLQALKEDGILYSSTYQPFAAYGITRQYRNFDQDLRVPLLFVKGDRRYDDDGTLLSLHVYAIGSCPIGRYFTDIVHGLDVAGTYSASCCGDPADPDQQVEYLYRDTMLTKHDHYIAGPDTSEWDDIPLPQEAASPGLVSAVFEFAGSVNPTTGKPMFFWPGPSEPTWEDIRSSAAIWRQPFGIQFASSAVLGEYPRHPVDLPPYEVTGVRRSILREFMFEGRRVVDQVRWQRPWPATGAWPSNSYYNANGGTYMYYSPGAVIYPASHRIVSWGYRSAGCEAPCAADCWAHADCLNQFGSPLQGSVITPYVAYASNIILYA